MPPVTREPERLTSVGIDVGTTTTQVIVSELSVEDVSSGGATRLGVTDREIVHRGEIRETPLVDPETIEVDAVAGIVDAELRAAGVEDVDTGAIIVTGETARAANAEPLAHRIAESTGEFVVATAGPELEAVLAGQGSGAARRAAEREETVANVDVGGGTTNIAVFDEKGVRDTLCLDVGGRLVRLGKDGTVSAVSDPVQRLARAEGLELAVATIPDREALVAVAKAMADRVIDALTGPPYDESTLDLAIGSLPAESIPLDAVAFSGGVGRLLVAENDASGAIRDDPEPGISDPGPVSDDWRAYADLGPLLAAALAGRANETLPVVTLEEDIRATVVGAGTRTTRFSGNTIHVESDGPLRNLPAFPVGELDCERSELGDVLSSAVETARERHEAEPGFALAISDVGSLSYERIEALAAALADAYTPLPSDLPLVVVTRQNCAKVLGQGLARRVEGRSVVAIDELTVDVGDYLDIGTPMRRGGAVPVAIKTLAFDS